MCFIIHVLSVCTHIIFHMYGIYCTCDILSCATWKLHILLPFETYFSVHFLRRRIFSNMITAQLSTAVNLTLILYFHLIYGPRFLFVIWPNNVLFSTSWPSPGSSLGPGIAFSCDVTTAVLHFLWSWHFSKTQFSTLKNRVFLNRCLSDVPQDSTLAGVLHKGCCWLRKATSGDTWYPSALVGTLIGTLKINLPLLDIPPLYSLLRGKSISSGSHNPFPATEDPTHQPSLLLHGAPFLAQTTPKSAPPNTQNTCHPYVPNGKITPSLPREMDTDVAEMLFYCTVNRARQPLSSPAAAAAKSLQSCPTLCDPIDGTPPGPAVPGIL